MFAPEKTQVKYTGDWSSDSKLSSIQNGYWEDPFLSFFNKVDPPPKRTSLICRGYYVRFKVCDFFLRQMLALSEAPMQVVSLGCGMDTSFFRIFPQYEGKISKFIETDFASVTSVKKDIIHSNEILRMMARDKLSIVPSDLRDCHSVEVAMKNAGVDFSMPTLFYSECVVNYLEAKESESLLASIVANFPSCLWLAYEQCNANDAFGNIMLKHFQKNGCPLLSLPDTPTAEVQNDQLRRVGFTTHHVFNAWDTFQHITLDDQTPYPAGQSGSHMFDEYEALLATCLHYSVRVGVNGINEAVASSLNALANQLRASQLPCESYIETSHYRVYVTKREDLRTFHTSFSTSSDDRALILGGTDVAGKRSMSLNKLVVPNRHTGSNFAFEALNSADEDYERIAASAVYHARSKSFFVFGGRKSPRHPCSEDMLQISSNEQRVKKKLLFPPKECPPPRWRHSMAVVNDSLVLFGGKNECGILGDLWTFDILKGRWHQQRTSRPQARHSHVMCSIPNSNELYLIGGMCNEASLCKDSVIKFVYSTEAKTWTWLVVEELKVHGCRIGHQACISNENLVVVGGYGPNSMYNLSHFATVVHLNTFSARCVSLPTDLSMKFLPFGFSLDKLVVDDDEKLLVYGGGGNCFSFGTHLNPFAIVLSLSELSQRTA